MDIPSDIQKIKHGSIRSSLMGLWFEYLYGDGWRLVEIMLGTQVLLRGVTILLFSGMSASYYTSFPMSDEPLFWGLVSLVIGGARIAGTVINGRWRRSPRLRLSAGIASFAYQGMHCYFFWDIGLSVIAMGYLFWTTLEAMGVIRSMIDIDRGAKKCPNG